MRGSMKDENCYLLLPIFQIVQSPTSGKVETRAFQTMDPLADFQGCLNHSSVDKSGKYFD
jgi:hypothetical protein